MQNDVFFWHLNPHTNGTYLRFEELSPSNCFPSKENAQKMLSNKENIFRPLSPRAEAFFLKFKRSSC